MGLLFGLEGKSIRNHRGRAHRTASGGLHLLQPALSQCHTHILFVHPRCNYRDLHRNLLPSPCLLSACREFKAARGVRAESAGKFAELQQGRRAHFSQLMKSLESIFIKSIEGKPQDWWQKGTRGCYGEKSSLKPHRTLGERPSRGTMNYEKLSTTPTNEMATVL